ncbi:hypothetical protein OIDMADRAFT_26376 [Oidiodendron maius Zn]|uniref:Uncharacterized protein n=1 Tax=Oidiodendron maius (strain Zn) TaxID=913774 RepID=A0A0C3HL08_OIDMZ|nr:hypothetical protein OIDMADRAFT_26376 [Oidiodendron maius Zn]
MTGSARRGKGRAPPLIQYREVSDWDLGGGPDTAFEPFFLPSHRCPSSALAASLGGQGEERCRGPTGASSPPEISVHPVQQRRPAPPAIITLALVWVSLAVAPCHLSDSTEMPARPGSPAGDVVARRLWATQSNGHHCANGTPASPEVLVCAITLPFRIRGGLLLRRAARLERPSSGHSQQLKMGAALDDDDGTGWGTLRGMAEACPNGDTRARCLLSVQCFASFRRIDWTCRTAALSPQADPVAICSLLVPARRPPTVSGQERSWVCSRCHSLALAGCDELHLAGSP